MTARPSAFGWAAGVLLGFLALSSSADGHRSATVREVREIRGRTIEVDRHEDPVSALQAPRTATEAAAPPLPSSGLPRFWCGTPRTTDDTANEAGALTDPKIKVVYAYPSDARDRLLEYADELAADATMTVADMIQRDVKTATGSPSRGRRSRSRSR